MNTTTASDQSQWLATHSDDQLRLARDLDDIVRDALHVGCLDGEAQAAWDVVVTYATTGYTASNQPQPVAAALDLARTLGGFWFGDGCLWHTGTRAEGNSHHDDADELLQWVSLDEMAARTGKVLPPQNTPTPAATAPMRRGQRNQPSRSTRSQRNSR